MHRLRGISIIFLTSTLLSPIAAEAQFACDCCGPVSPTSATQASDTRGVGVRDGLVETSEPTGAEVLAVKPAPEVRSIVVDLGKQRLFLVKGKTVLRKYAISSGRPQYPTPTGSYRISAILRNAWWNPPSSSWAKGKKPVPPGPNNPMGPVKMRLGATNIFIHGIPAKEEAKLGSPASHGCIRLASRNALQLASLVKVGTAVKITPWSRFN